MAKTRVELILDAENRTDKAFRKANTNISKLEKNVRNLQRLGNVFTGLFAVNQITGYAQDLARIADEWKNIEGRLNLVTDTSEELRQVQDDLFKVSQETASSYAETAKLYAQVARNSEALGLTNKDLLDLTEVINKSIQVSGTSAQSASAAITQLNQALGSGVLRGDEFNSIMENSPRLAQALADGLGVAIGALRGLAEDGELTAERVTKALLDQKSVIEEEYATLPDTVGRSITKLNNEWIKFVGTVDASTGATDSAAKNISALAAAFNAVTSQVDRFSDAFSIASEVSSKVNDALLKLIPGADFIKAYLLLEKAQTKSNEAANDSIEITNELKEATDELTGSEYALQFAQEKENEILAGRTAKVNDVLNKLKEESKLLKLSAKEQFIYNQIKRAGTDITEEQADSIREAAAAFFDERLQIKATEKTTRQLAGATREYKQTKDSVQSISSFGKAKKETEELTEETEKATKAKKEWFSVTGQPGKDTSGQTVTPSELTRENGQAKAQEFITAAQEVFNQNPIVPRVRMPTAKSIVSDPVTASSSINEGGFSTISISRDSLKEGSKA